MTIKSWRSKIDKIDDQILSLLSERAVFVFEIGKIKKEQNMRVYVPEREKWIIDRMVSNNPGPLNGKSIKTLFERIIDESRRLERAVVDKNS